MPVTTNQLGILVLMSLAITSQLRELECDPAARLFNWLAMFFLHHLIVYLFQFRVCFSIYLPVHYPVKVGFK